MVRRIKCVGGAQPLAGPAGVQKTQNSQNTSTANVDMRIPDTKEAKETAKRIKTAKYQLEVLKVKAMDPNIKPMVAKAMQFEIKKLEAVYRNTSYEILPDGNVTFTVKSGAPIDVADFKKAYGLKDGALQGFLKARHEKEDPDIVKAEIYIDGQKRTEDDYPDDMTRYFEGSVASGSQGFMELDYLHSDKGSYIKYSDGYVSKKVGLFLGGCGPQAQYDGMSLRSGDSLTLGQKQIKEVKD